MTVALLFYVMLFDLLTCVNLVFRHKNATHYYYYTTAIIMNTGAEFKYLELNLRPTCSRH